MRKLMLAAVAGLLAACATATPYQPAPSGASAGYGFSEQQIENNRLRITFRGNSVTDRETVETYLLYRAAEVTLQGGHDYFVVAERDIEEHSRLQGTGPSYSGFYPGFFYRNRYFARGGWSPWYDPFWHDPWYGSDYREVTRYEAIAEITMHSGRKPADNANAFDAREVQANLQGRIVRPPAAG